MTMRPAIFLDRDDTLIEDMGYSADPERVRLKPGAARALTRLHDAGYALVVVTNQSGVARGYFTEEQLAVAHRRMKELLKAESAALDGIYHCPYLPGPDAVVEAYRQESELRKPHPGMLTRAARELSLDLPASWMIGDAPRDVEAGRAAGCRTILLGDAASVRGPAADFTAPTLPEAVDMILSNGRAPSPPRAAPPMSAGGGGALGVDASSRASASTDSAALESTRELVDELHHWMRESRRDDFGAGHLIGAMAQTFAVAALAWGLFGMFDPEERSNVVIRLLAAIAFQLIAMTYLMRRR